MPAGWKPKCYSREAMKFLNDFDGVGETNDDANDI